MTISTGPGIEEKHLPTVQVPLWITPQEQVCEQGIDVIGLCEIYDLSHIAGHNHIYIMIIFLKEQVLGLQ